MHVHPANGLNRSDRRRYAYSRSLVMSIEVAASPCVRLRTEHPLSWYYHLQLESMADAPSPSEEGRHRTSAGSGQ